MAIKTSTHRKKQTTLRPDSSNCNSLYGIFEIGLIGTHTSSFTAGVVNLVNLSHTGS